MSLRLERTKKVAFIDISLKKAFEELQAGKYEDKRLAGFIQRAINDLKENPLCGIKIPSNLWPKEYVKKYGIDNLRKYGLPDGWRLLYTLRGNEIEIISILIEWFNHTEYERKFKYSKNK